MIDLEQRVKDQLKDDLTSLIRLARQYGCDAEETKDYFHHALRGYERVEEKKEFQYLGSTVLLFMDGESPQKSLYEKIKEVVSH